MGSLTELLIAALGGVLIGGGGAWAITIKIADRYRAERNALLIKLGTAAKAVVAAHAATSNLEVGRITRSQIFNNLWYTFDLKEIGAPKR